MKIISKYIFAELTPIFIIGNFFFIFLLILDKLVNLADLFFTKNVPGYLILQTLFYYLPSFLVITIPTTVLLATMIGFSRLSVDSELIVLKASGMSFAELAVPAFLFGFLTFLLGLAMSSWLMPLGSKLAIENLTKIAKSISIKDIKPNELYTSIPDRVIFVKEKDKNGNFKNIVVIDKKYDSISSAKKGQIYTTETGEIIFNLEDGRIISKLEDGYSAVSFNKFIVNIPIVVGKNLQILNEKFMTLKSLKENFSKSKIYKHEFSSRFALPFASLIMSIFGMTLGSFFSRTGKSFGVFIAIALVFIYNSIYIISKNLSFINPFLSPWLANIFFMAIALIYFRKASR